MPEEILAQCLLKPLNTSIRYQRHFLRFCFFCFVVLIYVVRFQYGETVFLLVHLFLADTFIQNLYI